VGSNVARALPYSVVRSVTAPDMQMVVVPATSTSATTEMTKVNFTVLPLGRPAERVRNRKAAAGEWCARAVRRSK